MIWDDSGLLLQLIQALKQKSTSKQTYHCTTKKLSLIKSALYFHKPL